MFKTTFSLKSIKTLILTICIFPVLFFHGSVEAQTVKDPLLDYSCHVKFDLKWLHDMFRNALVTSDPEEKYKIKLKNKFDLFTETGIFDLESITIDCRLVDDRFIGTAKIETASDALDETMLQRIISLPPQASVVRALIPPDAPLVWLSAANPSENLDNAIDVLSFLFDKLLVPEERIGFTEESIQNDVFLNLSVKLNELMGDEAHFVLYGFKVRYNLPQPEFAFVLALKDDISTKELENIKEIFITLLVEQGSGELSRSKWNDFEVLNFKGGNLLFEEALCVIVDKSYLIASPDLETLQKTAEFVLTPSRTAQSQLPIAMNCMLSVNLTKLIELTSNANFDFLFDFFRIYSGEEEDYYNKYLKDKELGAFQLIITNTSTGALIEFSIDRKSLSLLMQMIQELSGVNLRGSMSLIAGENDWITYNNFRTVNSLIDVYYIDHNNQYPTNINILVEGKQFSYLPTNPFTNEVVQNRTFSERAEGDFTYIPVIDTESGLIESYFLILYGDKTVGYDTINNDTLLTKGIVEKTSDGVVDDVLCVLVPPK